MAGTFISYRRDDAAGYAGRLRESLEHRLGADRVFRDVDGLKPGQDFVDAIEARLAACRVMLVVIGREWLDARTAGGLRRLDDPFDFVRLEVAAGLARPSVLVIPVLVEGADMPAAAALPEQIRPLARRHAVSVRDETWAADVERLATLIDDVEAAQDAPHAITSFRHVPPAMRAAAALGVAVLLAAGYLLGRSSPLSPGATSALLTPARTVNAGARDPEPATTSTSTATPDPVTNPGTAPYTIDVPRLAEAAFGDVVFSIVSGNVIARDGGRELRLRMRVSNREPRDLNFWRDGFRLEMNAGGGEQSQPPATDFSTIVPGRSLRYGIVPFRLAPTARRATLEIRHRGGTATIPLDVSATGRPPLDEQAEIADSLAQAVMRALPLERRTAAPALLSGA